MLAIFAEEMEKVFPFCEQSEASLSPVLSLHGQIHTLYDNIIEWWDPTNPSGSIFVQSGIPVSPGTRNWVLIQC